MANNPKKQQPAFNSDEEASSKDFNFSLNDLLSGLIEFTFSEPEYEKSFTKRCPKCGLSITDIKHTGKMGCSQCYVTFARFIVPLIGKVQGSSHHKGKQPSHSISDATKKEMALSDLKLKLKQQIASEAYEDAAKTRDQIKKLEDQPKKKTRGKTKK